MEINLFYAFFGRFSVLYQNRKRIIVIHIKSLLDVSIKS